MADFKFQVIDKWPNILIVYGKNIFDGDYRTNIRDYLYALPTTDDCPVGKGTHDFWVTYGATPRSIGDGEFAHEDMTITPRPMRGIIRMGNEGQIPINVNDGSVIQAQLAILLQEFGHHWLVPRDLGIHNEVFWPSLPIKPYQMPGFEENALSLEEDRSFYGVPLLGRENSHWSAFFKSDKSVFDGIYWEDNGSEDGFQIWKARRFPRGRIVRPPAGVPDVVPGTRPPPIELDGTYNDLDLLIIGIKDPNEAYRNSNNKFSWIEPRLTAPLNYFAGLCIAFDQYDFLYFGFYSDHRQLATWLSTTSDSPQSSQIFPLPSDYRPLRNKFNSVALRMVRRGDNYYFQARLPDPQQGKSLLEDIEPLDISPPGSNLDRFRTLGTIKYTGGEPKAMGLIVKTSTNNIVCDAAFRHLEVLTGTPESGSETIITTDRVPPDWEYTSVDGYSSLPPFGSLIFNRPIKKARARVEEGWIKNEWILITTPYLTLNKIGGWDDQQSYKHSSSVDMAPKILTRVPIGDDFAIATLARINRSSFCPWYAGAIEDDMRIWGKQNSANTRDVFVSGYSQKKQVVPDPDNKYKVAFIIAAEEFSDIQDWHVHGIDVLRQWWDASFDVVTLGRRHSYSKLR